MSARRLEGRVAVVTGASRGIGAALAQALAAEGASVACAARTERVWDERLPGTIHDTVATIRESGGRAIAVRCDLTDEADVEHLAEETTRALGPVDVLINNAALTAPGRPPRPGATGPGAPPSATLSRRTAPPGFLGLPLKSFRLHFEIDVFAVFRLMQLVLPGMIDRGSGAVLNITSDASRRPGEGPWPDPGGATPLAYGGAKAALEHLTRAVAFEVAPYGVGVNALMPSLPIATPGLQVTAPGLDRTMPVEQFSEAALRVLAAPVDRITGQVVYSHDVLHPELGRRGWLGD